MAFSKSSLPLLLGPFINSFIMICESMLSVSQDGLLREMLLAKYRLQIFDYIYIRFQILLVSKSIGFFWWGAKIIPPYFSPGSVSFVLIGEYIQYSPLINFRLIIPSNIHLQLIIPSNIHLQCLCSTKNEKKTT